MGHMHGCELQQDMDQDLVQERGQVHQGELVGSCVRGSWVAEALLAAARGHDLASTRILHVSGQSQRVRRRIQIRFLYIRRAIRWLT